MACGNGGCSLADGITIQRTKAPKPAPASVAKPRKVKVKEPRDSLTLARLITEAVSDVRATLVADPHLRLLLRDLAAAEDVDAEKTAIDVDGYVATMVANYLSNKRRKPRVRFPRVLVMSSANLAESRARCVVRVTAWGYAQRFILDLELNK